VTREAKGRVPGIEVEEDGETVTETKMTSVDFIWTEEHRKETTTTMWFHSFIFTKTN